MPPDAPGYYVIAQLDGHDVAGIGMPIGGAGPSWHTYVAVDDADAAADAVRRPAERVLDAATAGAGPGGRAAVVADPQGAAFRLWQPRRRLGAQVVNAPERLELQQPAHPRAGRRPGRFYAEVFGWEFDEMRRRCGDPALMVRQPGYGDHLAATVDPDDPRRGRRQSAPRRRFADAVAWLAPLTDGDMPHWQVTFTVARPGRRGRTWPSRWTRPICPGRSTPRSPGS